MKRRLAENRVQSLLKQFPCLTILGARQVGKSTLAQLAFPHFTYIDLENPVDFNRLQMDLPYFLESHRQVIFDEAQTMPELFPALRSHLDKNKKFKAVLLGSAAPSLLHKVSESLTGRTAFFQLGGISILEESNPNIWYRGAFPRLHWSKPKVDPTDWYTSYLKTYLAQDIPQLGFRISQVKLRNLLSMIAHAQGSICNLSELGTPLGIRHRAVSHIIDIFEGTFTVRRLQPYFSNQKKRIVKSPKIYVRDTGLLHFLLGLGFEKKKVDLSTRLGSSFETFCIEQILTVAELYDSGCEAYFYRTQAGLEVDLVLRTKGKLIPIEIKVSPPSSYRSLERALEDLKVKKGYVVTATKEQFSPTKAVTVLPLEKFLQLAPKW